MSSLLTRRRVLTAIAADQVEGGGPNDGKYLAVADSGSQTARWVSSDFGVSWTKITNAASYPTGSFHIDCSGSLYYAGGSSTGRNASANCPLTNRAGTVAYNYIRVDRSYYSSYAAAGSSRDGQTIAIATDSDIKILSKNTSQATYGLSASLVRTIPIPAALNKTTTLPNGRCFSSDQTFTRMYLSTDENCHWGKGWTTDAYITLDGGSTWTSVFDAVSNNSQSLQGQVRGAQWSEDGKYCAISIRETVGGAYVNTWLYLSKNYGRSFERLTTPAGYEIGGVVASEKFNYMYLNAIRASDHYATIFRSTNKGKTWTLISQSSAYREPPMMLCNAKGDKLVNGAMSGSVVGNSQLLYYSHNYGDTWQANTTGVKVRPQSGNVTRYAMSRDYIKDGEVHPTGSYVYSMSLAEAQSALYQAVNTGTGTLRVSVDGYTLVSSTVTSYLDTQSYPGYSLFNVEDLPTVSGQSGPQLIFAYNSNNDSYSANVGVGWGVNSSDTSGDFYNSSQATDYAVDILINRLVGLAGNNPIYVSYSN